VPTWIRVTDPSTGHQFDVDERDPRIGHQLEPVKGYPTNSGLTARPRPAKHRTSKGRRAAKPTTTSEAGTSAETPEEK